MQNDPPTLGEALAQRESSQRQSAPNGSRRSPSQLEIPPPKASILALTDKDQDRITPPEKRQFPRQSRRLSAMGHDIRGVLDDLIFGRAKWPLFLWSSVPGTGKTCAGLVVCDLWPMSRAWRFEDFAADLVDVKMGRHWCSTISTWWDFVQKRMFVLIDDVGAGPKEAKDTQYEALKGVLDRRIGLPLMLTSNLSHEALEKVFDARVVDRIAAGTVIEVKGESRRW